MLLRIDGIRHDAFSAGYREGLLGQRRTHIPAPFAHRYMEGWIKGVNDHMGIKETEWNLGGVIGDNGYNGNDLLTQ